MTPIAIVQIAIGDWNRVIDWNRESSAIRSASAGSTNARRNATAPASLSVAHLATGNQLMISNET